MTTSPGLPGGYQPPPGTQVMAYRPPEADVAMSEQHYERCKTRVRREIKGSHTASLWIALALAVGGVGATLAVTIWSASSTLSAANKGKMEAVAWCCLAIVVLLGFVHWRTWRDADGRADDVIQEMDTYVYHRQ